MVYAVKDGEKEVSLKDSISISLVSLFGNIMIPVGIPVMLGVVEAFMTATLIALGVPPAIASSASILTRIISMWFEVVVTAIYSVDIFQELFKRSGLRSSMHSNEPKAISNSHSKVG